jgi:hypothetical protein
LNHIYRSSHEGVLSALSVHYLKSFFHALLLYMSISEIGFVQMRHFTSVLKSIVN